jgi:uncharacterized protein with GYD domain
MPTYVLLSRLTAEGRKTIKERPNRIAEVNKEVEQLNARVKAQFAVLGPYDFVTILDAPDNETVGKVSVELCSRGTVEIVSMPAMAIESFTRGLGKPKEKKK